MAFPFRTLNFYLHPRVYFHSIRDTAEAALGAVISRVRFDGSALR